MQGLPGTQDVLNEGLRSRGADGGHVGRWATGLVEMDTAGPLTGGEIPGQLPLVGGGIRTPMSLFTHLPCRAPPGPDNQTLPP